MHWPRSGSGRLPIRSQEHLPLSTQGSSEGSKGRHRVTEDTAGKRKNVIEAQKAEIAVLKSWKDKYSRKYSSAKDRIAELEGKIETTSTSYGDALRQQDQRIQAIESDLAKTKELLAARTKELSSAQTFLSTTDRLSEAEVLGIVRDLNENIFQVAANLTEEWEKLRSSRSSRYGITKEDLDNFCQSYGPALIHRVHDRDPVALTFLVQSCLCDSAIQITSRWQHNKQFGILRSIHQSLSTSEGQAISARWRSLTHTHLPEPPSHSDSVARYISNVLFITGLFPTTRESLEFVGSKVLSGIETIDQLAMRLETVFMVDVTSSDMCLLFEPPCTTFDDGRMSRECDDDKTPTTKEQDKVAGTTEVGVEKTVFVRGNEGPRTKVLLKTKVILEKDLADL